MDIYAQAAQFGIESEYFDGLGHLRRASPDVLRQVIDALAGSPDALEGDGTDPGGGVPEAAFQGSFDRAWLLAVQLYAVRSTRNWGIGDFTDLANLIRLSAQLGAAGVGLNPLHALFEDRPTDCSPYSPNSRLFLNPLYIDVSAIPECPPPTDADRDVLSDLRETDSVDYGRVSALKMGALRDAYRAFRTQAGPSRRAAFQAFRIERGPLLARFAAFEVLRRRLKGPWWEWPAEWQRPDEARLAALRGESDEAAEALEYVEFVQWIADSQLTACRDLAGDLKLAVGLYLDLAVGVQADGFDAWNEQTAISRQLAVGAPPDALNIAGQDWGLAGFNAVGLRARNFAPYRETLRAAMRHAGAIRLDHVLGLKRLYVIPGGRGADEGVYVQMPFQSLLAVTAEESRRCQCIVIGEDLGTVPPGFREALAEWGIWSYRVMMFERDWDGTRGFLPPDAYADNALVTFGTHDLAPFASWIAGADIELKQGLGLDPGETRDERAAAVQALQAALQSQGLEGENFLAAAAYLARARSRLLVIAVDDILGSTEQINVPGTVHQHPNWRRKWPRALEGLGDDPIFHRLADAMKQVERSQSG